MKRTIGFLALGVLAAAAYGLVTLPIEGGSLVQTVASGLLRQDPYISICFYAGVVAFLVVVFRTIRRTRFIIQENRLATLHATIKTAAPWVLKLEESHALARRVNASLDAMEGRVEILVDEKTGVVALEARAVSLFRKLNEKLNAASRDGNGKDIADEIARYDDRVDAMGDKLDTLEKVHEEIPDLIKNIRGFENRVKELEADHDKAVEDLTAAFETMDELFTPGSDDPDDDDYEDEAEGKLVDLLAGDEDHDGTIDKQFAEVCERTELIERKLDAIEEAYKAVPELEGLVQKLTQRAEALEGADGFVQKLEETRSALNDLVDFDDDSKGKVAELEAGDTNQSETIDEQVDELVTVAKDITGKLDAVEAAYAKLPALKTTVEDLTARTEALSAKDGLIGQLEEVRDAVNELLDEDGDGKVADLENDGGSSDEIVELVSRTRDIHTRVEALRAGYARLANGG